MVGMDAKERKIERLLGDDAFVKHLEKTVGRDLRTRKGGRKLEFPRLQNV